MDKTPTSKSSGHSEHVAPASARKGHFKFRMWHALVLIVLIIAGGVLVLRFSHASDNSLNAQAPTAITDTEVRNYIAQFTSRTNQKATKATQVSGEVPFTYKPKAGVAVSYVAWYVDKAVRATDSTSPYEYQLNTNLLANGLHTVSTAAYNQNNIVVGFSNYTIDVQNGGGLQGVTNTLTYPWQVIFGDN